jgi:hypothetical protein
MSESRRREVLFEWLELNVYVRIVPVYNAELAVKAAIQAVRLEENSVENEPCGRRRLDLPTIAYPGIFGRDNESLI